MTENRQIDIDEYIKASSHDVQWTRKIGIEQEDISVQLKLTQETERARWPKVKKNKVIAKE